MNYLTVQACMSSKCSLETNLNWNISMQDQILIQTCNRLPAETWLLDVAKSVVELPL